MGLIFWVGFVSSTGTRKTKANKQENQKLYKIETQEDDLKAVVENIRESTKELVLPNPVETEIDDFRKRELKTTRKGKWYESRKVETKERKASFKKRRINGRENKQGSLDGSADFAFCSFIKSNIITA